MRLVACLVIGVVGLLCARPSAAHLIDEVAANIVVDLATRDGRTFVVTYALHADQVSAFYDQARQLGVAKDRSDAAFAAELARGFVYESCTIVPTGAPATEPQPHFVAFRLSMTCPAPMRRLTLHRVDYNRAKTRTTLYIGVRVRERPTRRLLVPPRMAAVSLPVLQDGLALPVESTLTSPGSRKTPAEHGREAAADPRVDPLAGLPDPEKALRARRFAAWRPPPTDILLAWVEHGARHLATGVDHLLFLLALVMSVSSLSALVVAVLAFSAGHLGAMAAATLLGLPGHWAVEVAVGLSIVWAGWRARAAPSGKLSSGLSGVLAFGVVHGWAFGSGLRAMLAGSEGLLWPLAGFGVGLDLAQMVWCGALFAVARRVDLPRYRAFVARIVMVGGVIFALLAAL